MMKTFMIFMSMNIINTTITTNNDGRKATMTSTWPNHRNRLC